MIYEKRMQDYSTKINAWTPRPRLGSEYLLFWRIYATVCTHYSLRTTCILHNVFRTAFNKLSNDLKEDVKTIVAELKDLPNTMSVFHGDPSSSTPSTPLPPFLAAALAKARSLPSLDREDFKKLDYWFEESYKQRKGAPKVEEATSDDLMGLETDDPQAKKDTSLSCFMENKDRNPLLPTQKKELLLMVRLYWQFLFDKGKAPSVSSLATIDTKLEFRNLMESNFDCLRFCDSHWKVGRLWTAYYPTWLKGALKQLEEKKAEEARKVGDAAVIVLDDDNSGDGDNGNKTGKRSRPNDDEVDWPKRPRVGKPQPARPEPTKARKPRVRTLI